MPSEISDDLKSRIGELRRGGASVAAISEELNCSISTASKYQGYVGTPIAAPEWQAQRHSVSVRRDDGTRELTSYRPNPARAHLLASDAIYERLASIAPTAFESPPEDRLGRPAAACFNLFDCHFGKLAWTPETGSDYDLRIAERMYRSALASLVDYAKPFRLERAFLGIGSDLFHVDNGARQTTAGTPMDTDGRHAKIIEIVVTTLVAGVEYLLQHADEVHGLFLPGNHDRLTSYFACRELAAYFRNEPRVSIDCGPTSRKYIHYGRNLIGFTHGDGLRDPKSLPLVMASERPQEWAASVCREWHLGHLHTSKKFSTRDTDEYVGVQMRWMSALSGTDAWHYDNGYVGNRRAAEVYLYDKDLGYKGHFIAGGE